MLQEIMTQKSMQNLLDQLAECNIERVVAHSRLNSQEKVFSFDVKTKFNHTLTENGNAMFSKHPELKEVVTNAFDLFSAHSEGKDIDAQTPFIKTALDVETGIISESLSSFQGNIRYFRGATDYIDEVNAFKAVDGASSLVVNYAGGGDSGDVISANFYDAKGALVDEENIDKETKAYAEYFCYKLISEVSPGWEVNEGSEGEIDFNLLTGQIEIEHTSFYEDSFDVADVNTTLDALGIEEDISKLKALFGEAKELSLEYEGSGDQGDFVIPYLCDDKEQEVDTVLDKETEEELERLTYSLLDRVCAGWEINRGSQGAVKINLDSGDVKIEQTIRHEEGDSNGFDLLLSAEVVYDPEVDGSFEAFFYGQDAKPSSSPAP